MADSIEDESAEELVEDEDDESTLALEPEEEDEGINSYGRGAGTAGEEAPPNAEDSCSMALVTCSDSDSCSEG